ncbi:hypothetical protein HH310_41685 [Actinoplanes sp. TBRC 11911]|uniref:hypothetical protein n=1 Tax=Actinoplanes sp. TBRC 11911 TaxID=2729386 RepID=UPI00145F3EA4|nr:hypothetical protein [Actinoplanes sp. TBRC 11911]NMO57666.1 hypothetical protein [Actinoplanes sp. TBRC 11911]
MQPGVVPRSDLTQLLGQRLLEGHALEVCREYRLVARAGALFYENRDLGVEVAVDQENRVAYVTLHFRGDQGFRPYQGMLPGRGGTIAKKMSLWGALGRPWRSAGGVDEWVFPGFVMQAQYERDDDHVLRINIGR